MSLLTCGRLWERVTPRSTSSRAAGLEVIEVPRVGVDHVRDTVHAYRFLEHLRASAESSLAAMVKATTYREKMSSTTYRS